jgi:hypothetical protein
VSKDKDHVYRKTLGWVNRHRRRNGDPALDELLTGHPLKPSACTLANSIGHGVRVTADRLHYPWDPYPRWLPFVARSLVRQFDEGKWPELLAPEWPPKTSPPERDPEPWEERDPDPWSAPSIPEPGLDLPVPETSVPVVETVESLLELPAFEFAGAVACAPAAVIEAPAPLVEEPAPVVAATALLVEAPRREAEVPAPVVETPAPAAESAVVDRTPPLVEAPRPEPAGAMAFGLRRAVPVD